ncbi:MAG: hypothetical protein OEQ28_12850 [Acidobacteriota bacterium]|nr:hypothetical protein [Acidobacteriota bacterium]
MTLIRNVFKLLPALAEGKGKRDPTTRLFISNLVPDVYGKGAKRGSYHGYWIDDSKRKPCEAELISPVGNRSRSWGAVQIPYRIGAMGDGNRERSKM